MSKPVTIEAADAGFSVFLPGAVGEGHHIHIPLTEAGFRLLHSILQARTREADNRIGHAHAPTQEMVRAFLAANRPAPQSDDPLDTVEVNL